MKIKLVILFFFLSLSLIFLLILSWAGRPEPWVMEQGGCTSFNTKDENTNTTQYRHYRFEKCMRYNGLAVNVSIYDLQTNERLFSKTVFTNFDNLGFMSGQVIDCGIGQDYYNNNAEYESCDLPMNYSNWYGAYREFSFETPRYYLTAPHERQYTEPEF